MPDDLLGREQAAGYADLSVPTMDRARYAKRLRYTTSSPDGKGRVLMRRAWIDDWLETFVRVVVVLVVLASACHVICQHTQHQCFF